MFNLEAENRLFISFLQKNVVKHSRFKKKTF